MGGSPRAERYSVKHYEDEPTDHGFMVRHRETPKCVERTDANDHFFLWNTDNERFELIYHGSADIISFLRLHREVDKQLVDAGKDRRPLAFFNVHGDFFNHVFADAVVMNVDMQDTGHKHTATFDTEDGKTFATAIDYVYCLALPRPHEPGRLSDHETPEDLGHDSPEEDL